MTKLTDAQQALLEWVDNNQSLIKQGFRQMADLIAADVASTRTKPEVPAVVIEHAQANGANWRALADKLDALLDKAFPYEEDE